MSGSLVSPLSTKNLNITADTRRKLAELAPVNKGKFDDCQAYLAA